MKTQETPMYDKINDDIKVAMKAKQKEKLLALRYLKSMLMENSTSKKPVPEMDVIVKHHKKLKDGLSTYPAEHPMHEQTISELEFVGAYLPAQLSESDVANLIESIKASLENPNMGAVMKELQPKIKGQFDGKKASDMVKAALS